MPVTVTQYLGLTGEPIPKIGLDRGNGHRPKPKSPCKGKSSTEENTSWQPRKRLRRRKRNTNRRARTIPRSGPFGIPKGLSGEAPPARLFRFWGSDRLSVVSLRSSVLGPRAKSDSPSPTRSLRAVTTHIVLAPSSDLSSFPKPLFDPLPAVQEHPAPTTKRRRPMTNDRRPHFLMARIGVVPAFSSC
jgi:hypothetical protein